MKRRGFLGMLAALPAMLLPRKVRESAIDIAKQYTIVEEAVEDWTDYGALQPILYKAPDPALFALIGDIVTVWEGDPRFTDSHAWYLKGGENLPTYERSRDRDLTRQRIQASLNALQDNEAFSNFPSVFPPKRAHSRT